eukprot:TRINITY_DN4120_c0_g2_i1.p1 TRINITY_DN4120_c0_g2~~TRINITY_DN4120_c0_g2_i1.p1  ORF type:complete len:489 (+),score=170.36 TRINITY_DN4120_c0_g2_i1:83-1468(+)
MVDHKLALDCGVTFVKDYYSKFASQPGEIAVMYSTMSIMSHHMHDKSPTPIIGAAAITEHLRKVHAEGVERKFSLQTLECHPSVYGSVIVIAKGTILMRKSAQDFSHVFLLAKDPQTQGYYIHNDCMELGQVVLEASAEEKAAAPVPAASPAPEKKTPASPVAQKPASPVRTRTPPPASPPRAAPEPKEEQPAAAPVEEAPKEPQQEVRAAEEAPAAKETTEEAPEQPEGTLSWARVAGAKAAAKPAPKAAPSPQKTREAPKPEPRPEHGGKAPPSKEQRKAETPAESARPTSWAGLVAGSGVGKSEHAAPQQRVSGGRLPARTGYEAKPAQSEEPKKEEAPVPRGEGEAPKATKANKKYQYAALYVSRLEPTMKEADIDTIFGQFGTIVGKTFRSGEFCFIDFDEWSAVRKAVEKSEKEGVFFRSHKLNVVERKSPEQRQKERELNTTRRQRPERQMVSE